MYQVRNTIAIDEEYHYKSNNFKYPKRCIIVSRPIHKSRGNVKPALFVYIITVMQVDSSDKPSL